MFKMPVIIFEDKYTQSMANCCSRLFESQCGITYRTNS